MLTTAQFNEKFEAKAANVQRDLVAITKLIVANQSVVSEDSIEKLEVLDDLLSSVQSFATAMYQLNELSPQATPDVDPVAEGS